ncbi:MAG: T9SS type A sorting domain-containing protein [Bacteroidota bacterium]
MKTLTILLLSLLSVIQTHLWAATPEWAVDFSRYSATMTITGRAVVADTVLSEEGALLGAFIGEECRGVAELFYDEAEANYFFLMLVYGDNQDNQPLTFRTYVPSADQVLENANTLTFKEDATWGSFTTPYHLGPAAFGTQVTAFSLPNQPEVEVTINPNNQEILLTAYVVDPENPELDLSAEVADFTLSPFAVAFREGALQVSGDTPQDFTQPFTYAIVSGTLDTAYWRVSLTFRDVSAITGFATPNVVAPFSAYPNPARDYLTIEFAPDQKLLTSLMLLSVQGHVVWQQALLQERTLTISVADLPRGAYFLLGQTEQGIRYTHPLQITH